MKDYAYKVVRATGQSAYFPTFKGALIYGRNSLCAFEIQILDEHGREVEAHRYPKDVSQQHLETFNDFMGKVTALLPNSQVGEDSEGQLVIYTGLMERGMHVVEFKAKE